MDAQASPNPEFVAKVAALARVGAVAEICGRAAASVVEEVMAQPDFGAVAENPERFVKAFGYELKITMLRFVCARMGLSLS